jgi:hypothetical protein
MSTVAGYWGPGHGVQRTLDLSMRVYNAPGRTAVQHEVIFHSPDFEKKQPSMTTTPPLGKYLASTGLCHTLCHRSLGLR